MLCESKIIRMNPKYRIIKYNNDYFMVDTISHWITFLFPMINWFVPKRYAKLSEEEYNNLDIVKPVKNSGASIGAGLAILISALLRNYVNIFNIQIQKCCCIELCYWIFRCIYLFLIHQ